MEYPKINSLYKRQFTETDPLTDKLKYMDKGKSGNPLIIGEYACEEFGSINKWTVTEKVDGTNVRVIFDSRDSESGTSIGKTSRLTFGGRTNSAQMPTRLLTYLQDTFTQEKMGALFSESSYVVLFGEGYGGKIQAGGRYRLDPSFALFDVFIDGYWLKRENVHDIANKLGINEVPWLCNNGSELWTKEDIEQYVRQGKSSLIAQDKGLRMEGVVARSEPLMLFRGSKQPIMFKLKCVDFDVKVKKETIHIEEEIENNG